MKVIPLVRTEFARLTASRLGIASLIAIMIVPIVYGGLYLWGNKDPYGNLDRVPAALVVSDRGATLDGKPVNYGRDAAAQLVKDHSFGWKRVTESQARAGVTKGTYDFAVTFPSAFSADLASAGSSVPVRASIDLRTDDTNSYLGTTIAKQATEAVRVAVGEKVGRSASRRLLDAVASIRSGLVKAHTGASRLADGTAGAVSGAASLSAGLTDIDAETSRLPAKASQLATGAAAVTAGADSLASKAPAAASGSSTLSSGLGTLGTSMSTYRVSLVQAVESNPLLTADQKQQLLDGYDQLRGGEHTAASGASSLSRQLAALPSSTRQLATGAAAVSSGAAGVAASAPGLASGIHSAATGASTLDAGVTKIGSGASALSTSLRKGVDGVPASSSRERSAQAAQIAEPAAVTQHAVTRAQDYGAGLAPFFISLASWIGLYALFLLARPLSRRALTAVRRPIRTTLAGWLTPAMLGVVQAVALFLVVTLALGLQVANPAGLLGFMALVAITFAAMILALNVLFGSVGQFLALILMIVQLVTAGGTFPWQTLPAPLAFIHQALPMSHAVDGVRSLMYGGSSGSLWGPVTFLLYWLAGALLVATLGAARQGRVRTLVQLRPSAIGG